MSCISQSNLNWLGLFSPRFFSWNWFLFSFLFFRVWLLALKLYNFFCVLLCGVITTRKLVKLTQLTQVFFFKNIAMVFFRFFLNSFFFLSWSHIKDHGLVKLTYFFFMFLYFKLIFLILFYSLILNYYNLNFLICFEFFFSRLAADYGLQIIQVIPRYECLWIRVGR
jgi:hypothetical protein